MNKERLRPILKWVFLSGFLLSGAIAVLRILLIPTTPDIPGFPSNHRYEDLIVSIYPITTWLMALGLIALLIYRTIYYGLLDKLDFSEQGKKAILALWIVAIIIVACVVSFYQLSK
ncbi:MAG: hypothetical protein LBH01_06665 [Verrucomicrobiales bacterium]|jgi:hypothetical protein|nr:hypothetical protein [Verrucomicrobiales bacterium]